MSDEPGDGSRDPHLACGAKRAARARIALGKPPPELLERLFATLPIRDPRVIMGPQVGEDAAVLDIGDRYLIAKVDPITFVAEEIGWYAVHINANDLPVRGARPAWFLMTLLLPDGQADETLLADIFAQVIVYLVGAGPGDPALFTLRGVELLGRAEVVIYDGLVNRELLRFASPAAEIIYGGKHDRTRCVSQAELNALLLAKALEGKRVVRLKGGDPFVFGRGSEEALACHRAGIPFEIVPGVPSSYAVPAYAGIPLTHRHLSSAFTVITGHEDPTKSDTSVNYEAVPRLGGTIVILMGANQLPHILQRLLDAGLAPDTPAVLIEWGTTPFQRVVEDDISGINRTSQTTASWGAGGMVSTAADVARWACALFEGRVLSAASLSQMLAFREVAVPATPLVGFGLGALRTFFSGREYWGHGGDMIGYTAIMLYAPKERVSIAILFNQHFVEYEVGPPLLDALVDAVRP